MNFKIRESILLGTYCFITINYCFISCLTCSRTRVPPMIHTHIFSTSMYGQWCYTCLRCKKSSNINTLFLTESFSLSNYKFYVIEWGKKFHTLKLVPKKKYMSGAQRERVHWGRKMLTCKFKMWAKGQKYNVKGQKYKRHRWYTLAQTCYSTVKSYFWNILLHQVHLLNVNLFYVRGS